MLYEVQVLSLKVMDTMDCGKVVGMIFFCDVAGSMGEVPLIRFLCVRWVGNRRPGRGRREGGVPWIFELHGQG